MSLYRDHSVKKGYLFPVPSRDVTNQTLISRELLNYSRPVRIWLVASRLGTGKTITFFTEQSCRLPYLFYKNWFSHFKSEINSSSEFGLWSALVSLFSLNSLPDALANRPHMSVYLSVILGLCRLPNIAMILPPPSRVVSRSLLALCFFTR